jgi:hypothetical protein
MEMSEGNSLCSYLLKREKRREQEGKQVLSGSWYSSGRGEDIRKGCR